MKIRETYTVIREYPFGDYEPPEEVKLHCKLISEDASKTLYNGTNGQETVSIKFQIDDGTGWKDFDPEND